MNIFGYAIIKKSDLEAMESKIRKANEDLSLAREEVRELKFRFSNRKMLNSIHENTQNQLIQSLSDDLQNMKQKYADELQKRLALAEKVKEMEDTK